MNLADRLQHTSASQVVRAVEQSRAFLARELVQQLVSQKKNLLLEFYSWANKYFVDVCGTHVVGCCDKVRSL